MFWDTKLGQSLAGLLANHSLKKAAKEEKQKIFSEKGLKRFAEHSRNEIKQKSLVGIGPRKAGFIRGGKNLGRELAQPVLGLMKHFRDFGKLDIRKRLRTPMFPNRVSSINSPSSKLIQPKIEAVSSDAILNTKSSSTVTEPVVGNIGDKQGSGVYCEVVAGLREGTAGTRNTTMERGAGKQEPPTYRERIAPKQKGLLVAPEDTSKEQPEVAASVNESETPSLNVRKQDSRRRGSSSTPAGHVRGAFNNNDLYSVTGPVQSPTKPEPLRFIQRKVMSMLSAANDFTMSAPISSRKGKGLLALLLAPLAVIFAPMTYAATNPVGCTELNGQSISQHDWIINTPNANARCREQSLRAQKQADKEADNQLDNATVLKHNQEVRENAIASGRIPDTVDLTTALTLHSKRTNATTFKAALDRGDSRIGDLVPTTNAEPGDHIFGPVDRYGQRFATKRIQTKELDKAVQGKLMPDIAAIRRELAAISADKRAEHFSVFK
ncbi:MAG: hypothetical protein ACOYK1_01170 [Vampirovibrionia bacterium]